MIQIRTLGEHTLKKASSIADSEFTDADIPPSAYFKASILPGAPSIAGDDDRYTYMRYWTAEYKGNVAGIIGLYTFEGDDAVWLGWYCVSPEFRGKHIGSKLLTFALRKAKRMKRRHLKLFTSDAADEATAQIQYEKRGLAIVPGSERSKNGVMTFEREIDLGKTRHRG